MEPIVLFSRINDPAGVIRRLREIDPTFRFEGRDDDWQQVVLTFQRGGASQTLAFTLDPEYLAEPNWSNQMSGMRGYFSRFPESHRKPTVLALTTTFRFSLATAFVPDFDPDGDPRLDVLFEIASLLDGVLFSPSSLRDARGRILLSADGPEAEDPDAAWPKVVAQVSVADPIMVAMPEASPAEDEDEDGPSPPTPRRVARRALALTALTLRAILEQEAEDPAAEGTHRELLEWARAIGIEPEFEDGERAVFHRALGQLDPREQVASSWRLEGLVVLAWALGRFEIPPHDRLVPLDPLWESLGVLDVERSRALMESPTLRTRAEIGSLRGRLFALHWRLRDYHLNPRVLDFEDFARTTWFGPLDVSGLPLVGGDLAIRGERIDRASPGDFSTTHSSSQERHQAANWLWEGPDLYSDASVAT